MHARGIPVKLLVHARNREDLISVLGPAIKDVSFIEDTFLHRTVWAIAKRLPRRLCDVTAYSVLNLLTQVHQARLIKKMIAKGGVKLVHQPTPVSPLNLSAIYGLNVPVVIGPMNGGLNLPKGYEDIEGAFTRLLIAVGSKIALVLNFLVPGKRRAAALLVANDRTCNALAVGNHPNIIKIPENGVDFDVWSPRVAFRNPKPAGDPFRLIYLGGLVDWKAVDITLEALARTRQANVDVTLEIVGDGPELERLKQRSQKPDIKDSVTFSGFLTQAECAKRFASSDALILNSIWECGGAVVLEAMAMGLPVIASDWGGPADYLDSTCGVLVSPTPRNSFPERLAKAISKLAADPYLCTKMSKAGRAKVREQYDWHKKVDQILEVYKEVMTD